MEPNSPPDVTELAPPVTKPRPHRGISFFWLVPVAAVALSSYLFYQTVQAEGNTVEISFVNARDLLANKTELHYHGVKVGIVKKVALSPDFKSVIIKAQFDKSANNLAVEGSKFWIVYPQISLSSGISGLDTIINGNYIDIQAGNGEATSTFTGLSHPPAQDPSSPDLFIRLVAKTMPSVGMESPILFRQMKVGKVDDLTYDIASHQAYIEIRIYEEYRDLIRKDTHFWNTSGLNVSVGLSGLQVQAGSLDSIIFGSISMGIPDEMLATSPVVPEGTDFQLFDSLEQVVSHEAEAINRSATGYGLVLTLHFTESQGITPNSTELRYRGIKVGTVVSVSLEPDLKGVVAKVLLSPKYESLAKSGSTIALVWPQVRLKEMSRIQLPPDVVQGPYLRFQPGEGSLSTDFKVTETEDDSFRPLDGFRLTLRAHQVGKIKPGSPIYYRGVKVGQIETSALAADGTAVQIRAMIQDSYAPLIRANTKFWNGSGITSSISLMGGLQVKTDSLTGVLEGCVVFATPDNATMGGKVSPGAVFELADKPDDTWLKWQPTIPLN